MADYSQGKIYKLECNITNDVYYGSTTQSLSARMSLHKYSRTCTAINIIDRGNYTCKIIEEFPCKSRKELQARERWWIENNVCINKQIPGRTPQEWREDNEGYNIKYNEQHKEHIAQKSKEYHEANKAHIAQKNKEWREANKAYIAQKEKEWREANKAHIAQYGKKYRENNGDKSKEKFTCECGGKYTHQTKSQHYKTIKHQKYILSNSEN